MCSIFLEFICYKTYFGDFCAKRCDLSRKRGLKCHLWIVHLPQIGQRDVHKGRKAFPS